MPESVIIQEKRLNSATAVSYTHLQGSIGGVPVKKGDTLFAPQGIGSLLLEGKLDVFVATYRNAK